MTGTLLSHDPSAGQHHVDPLWAVRHVIVDRDGVLNQELEAGAYLANPDDFRWLPGALEALAQLRDLGVRVSVATNQSGIGRGVLSERDLVAVHQKMSSDVTSAGGSIDAIFYCPHSPEAACACRKPAPGLIIAAIGDSGISPDDTLVIGDDSRDLEAAQSAGVGAALVRTGKGRLHESYATALGVPVFNDLGALVLAVANATETFKPDLQSLKVIFADHAKVVAESAAALLPTLTRCIAMARRCLAQGHKIIACGNGGSAADAQHFIAELVGRYDKSRGALSGLVLGADTVTLTAVSNDFGFEHVFSRQIDALAQRGDVLIAISTSGNSRNVTQAAIAARQRGCGVIALTGRSGGMLAEHADVALRIPSDTVARIQEVHELCLHALAESLDSDAQAAIS